LKKSLDIFSKDAIIKSSTEEATMNNKQIAILDNDSDFHKWLDEQESKSMEAMEEDGFLLTQYEDYEDGYYERRGSGERW